ncbi:TetR family transcriptional regulator [Actinomadura sp. NBRC 104425]|uniref:TetR/AcrR family transcriptional regulator n=1 Tax=Actinomadura sp. NBRC 104425 TaxID=3032204 RepID=UPI0024A5B560|nr:TetR/AcrR family transcriptional regulator [Actinomadura sp. NBRC 104425]GLZ15690.1 TetR family transcriptional regulator [Actinomadura sp. NBRC 104425]
MGRTREFDVDAAVADAMDLFWRRGYAATSVQDLVAATGVGRGSLYAAFGSKDGLYEAALRRYAEESLGCMRQRLERGGPVRAVLRDLLLEVVDETVADPQRRGCLMTNTAVERLPGDPLAGRVVGRALDLLAELVEAALRRGRDRGELPPDADVTALADFVVTTIQGLRVQGKAGADRRRLAAVVDAALRALPAAPSQ